MLADMHAAFIAQLKAAYPRLSAKSRKLVGDADRADDYQDDVNNFFDRAQIDYARTGRRKARTLSTKIGQRTAEFGKRQLNTKFNAVLGVDVLGAEPWLQSFVDSFVRDNVDLITSIHKQYFDQIETEVKKAVTSGARWESLAEKIETRYDVSRSRANLIARDQTSKLNGDLDRVRQQKLGITTYVWRTSKDERVRDSHKQLEGKSIRWSKPPEVGHPGQDYQCRCTAEPDIDGYLDSL